MIDGGEEDDDDDDGDDDRGFLEIVSIPVQIVLLTSWRVGGGPTILWDPPRQAHSMNHEFSDDGRSQAKLRQFPVCVWCPICTSYAC